MHPVNVMLMRMHEVVHPAVSRVGRKTLVQVGLRGWMGDGQVIEQVVHLG